jgi:predicted phage tail protein
MTAVGTALGSGISMIGASLVLSGVSELISPQPGFPDMKQANTLQSFSFSGITNTGQVGTPVPIAYGRLYIGSSVISSGLDTDQL